MLTYPHWKNHLPLWAGLMVLMLALTPLARAQDDAALLGPFPAAAMAWTDADKEAQRQAGAQLITDLQAAVASGAKTFVIPKGDYRFAQTPPTAGELPKGDTLPSIHFREQVMVYGSPNLPAFITLDGAHDITIDGSGSTLYFEDNRTGLLLNQCRNVTLKNIALDYDPLPFIQGKIVATHFDSGEIDVEFDPAYLDPRSVAMKIQPDEALRGIAFDPATRRLKPDQSNFTTGDFWSGKIGPHTYRLQPRMFSGTAEQAHLTVGVLLVLWQRDLIYGRSLRMEQCAAMVLEDVSVYASAMTGILERGSLTQTIYRRDNIIRRPGTSRLLSCNGDALSTLTCMTGPLVEQCRMEYCGDDFMNTHAWYSRALVQESPTVVVTEALPHPRFGPGATVTIWDPVGAHYLGTRHVTACEPLSWTAQKDAKILPTPNPKQVPWTGRRTYVLYGTPLPAQRLTLDEPIALPENALFAYPQFNNAGTIVRDCDFVGTVGMAVLVRSAHTQFLHNRFADTGGNAINVNSEVGYGLYGESTYPQDVLIEGNQFTRCGIFHGGRVPVCALLVYTPWQMHDASYPDNPQGWVGNVRLVDNVFTDCPREAIRVLCARDVTLRGNTITRYNLLPSFPHGPNPRDLDRDHFLGMDHGIVLDHVLGVTLENNTLTQPGPATQGEYFQHEVTPAP